MRRVTSARDGLYWSKGAHLRVQPGNDVTVRTPLGLVPNADGSYLLLYTGLHSKRFIFQSDGVSDNLAYAMHTRDVPVAALFDTSGGTGLLPGAWPTLRTQFPCGFAGGLGPDNVLVQLDQINKVCSDDFPTWIDMETRVRVTDNSALDMVINGMDAPDRNGIECARVEGVRPATT